MTGAETWANVFGGTTGGTTTAAGTFALNAVAVDGIEEEISEHTMNDINPLSNQTFY